MDKLILFVLDDYYLQFLLPNLTACFDFGSLWP